jgi:enterochelin esterase-like enzyme
MKILRIVFALALGSLFLGAALQEPQGNAGELRKLRRERRLKVAEAEALMKGADPDPRKKAQALRDEADALGKSIASLVPEVVGTLLKDLKSGAPEGVPLATARLAEVGTPATPDLEALVKSGTPEEQARAKAVLKLIRDVEAGDTGLWKQWAASAKASSEYEGQGKNDPSDWSARQACGKPDTDEAGDLPTAWASQASDGGEEWLELTYKAAVRPARVRIHETFNPGAVVKIEALDPEKNWHVLWKGKDTTAEAPGYLEVRFDPPNFATRVLRVTLDTSEVGGWNEIDAVQLIGEPTGEAVPDVAREEAPAAPKGGVKSINFESKHIGARRNVKVWLPPGHDPKKSYPVFYTCDGMLNVNTKLVEPLIADGRIPPVIIVAIMHGPNLRMQEYVQTGSKEFAAHEKWFIEEVLPWAEREFGASKNRMERIVFGSSNGGPFSLTMGARHPDLFGHVVGAMVYALALSRWKKELAEQPKETQRFILYAGSQDRNGVRENAGVEKVLKERGYPVSSYVLEGEGHTNSLNQRMLPKLLEEAFGPKVY